MGRLDLTVTLRHPVTAGPAAVRGAEERLAQRVTDMVVGVDGVPLAQSVVRDPDTSTITFADWAVGSPALAASLLVTGYRQELAWLIPGSPELSGWKVEVTATPSDPAPTWPTAAITSPAPDQDTDEYTAGVLGAADLFHAFPLPTLTDLDWQDPDDPARSTATQHQARALAGCLIVAAEEVTDQLFDDLEAITAGIDVAAATQLGGQPTPTASRHTPAFTRQFLVAFVDLTSRLTREWTPTSCVAQDLGVRLLANQTEVIAEAAELGLPDGWRDRLYQLMLADTEYHHDHAPDWFTDDPTLSPPGMASTRFEDWFTPYPDGEPVPPFLGLKV